MTARLPGFEADGHLAPALAVVLGQGPPRCGRPRPLLDRSHLGTRKTRKVRVKALVPGCQNTTASLAVEAAAYVTAEDRSTVTCLAEASPAPFRVAPALKQKGRWSSNLCMPVPPPEPIPDDAGYTFYASGQRCKESVLAPLRRMTAVGEGRGGPGDEKTSQHHRALSPTTNPTPTECTQ